MDIAARLRQRRRIRALARGLLATLLAACGPPIGAKAQVDAGDRVFETRAETLEGRLAPVARTEEAIRAYRVACTELPEPFDACARLLRALHYLAEFTDAPESRKGEAVGEAVDVAKRTLRELPGRPARPEAAASLYFWSAIAWGAHGQRVGLLTIVREGVASKMFEYASEAIRLAPGLERGGGYRLLSRLHADLPRVPFVSGWVDRGQVLPLAERAYAVDPSDPGNRLILAMALLEKAPARTEEANTLLEQVATLVPRPSLRAEDLAIRLEAGALREALRDE